MKPAYPTPEHFRRHRVDPANLNHYMCYHCGEVEAKLIPYQQHMLQHHEVITQTYQLWSDTMNERYGYEWREETEHDSTDTAGEGAEQESDYEVSPPRYVPKRERKEYEDGSDEDYVYEPDHKRKKRDGSVKKAIKVRPKKKRVVELPRRPRMSQTPVEDFGMEQFHQSIKMEEGLEENSVQANSEISDLVNRILSEGKRKESASQDVLEEEEEVEPDWTHRRPLPTTASAMKYCRICRKTADFTFASLFQHYQDFHRAEFVSFNYYGYIEKKCIGKKVLKEKSHCQRCVQKFAKPQDYFQHMVHNHLYESVRCQADFKDATNADVEAVLKFRDRKITCGYNFKFQPLSAPKKQEVEQNQQDLGHDGSLPGPSTRIPTIPEEPEDLEQSHPKEPKAAVSSTAATTDPLSKNE